MTALELEQATGQTLPVVALAAGFLPALAPGPTVAAAFSSMMGKDMRPNKKTEAAVAVATAVRRLSDRASQPRARLRMTNIPTMARSRTNVTRP